MFMLPMRQHAIYTNRCGCHPPFGRPTTASVKGLRSIAGHSSFLRSDEHSSMRQRNVGTSVGKIFRLRRNFPSLRPTQRRPLTVSHNEKKINPSKFHKILKMRAFLKVFFKAIGLVLLLYTIDLSIELIGGDLEGILRKKLGDNYFKIVVFITLLLFVIQVTIEKINFFTNSRKDIESLFELQFNEIKNKLIGSYEKRLNTKLASRHPINLELTYST